MIAAFLVVPHMQLCTTDVLYLLLLLQPGLQHVQRMSYTIHYVAELGSRAATH